MTFKYLGTMDSNDSFSVVVEPGELGYPGLGPLHPHPGLQFQDQFDHSLLPHHPPFPPCGQYSPQYPTTKELSLCHKLRFSNIYFFCNPMSQTLAVSNYQLVFMHLTKTTCSGMEENGDYDPPSPDSWVGEAPPHFPP